MNRDDPRIRKVPLFFGRPNLTEMNRVYRELVTVTVGSVESIPEQEEIPSPLEIVPEVTCERKEIDIATIDKSVAAPEPSDTILNISTPSETETNFLSLFWSSLNSRDVTTIHSILLQRPHYGFLW